MNLHQTIKEQIKDAMRAKDSIKLDTLRSLNAMFLNEMIASGVSGDFLPDDKVLALVKRSVKQHKDSIEQFDKGGRADLAEKEKAELAILETYMPKMMNREEIKVVAQKHIDAAKAASGGSLDPKSTGKIVGGVMKELAGKADGGDVKAVIDEIMK